MNSTKSTDMHSDLQALFLKLERLNEDREYISEVTAWELDGLAHIYLNWVFAEETFFSAFSSVVNTARFAKFIGAIEIVGPDVGYNSVRAYDLMELVDEEEIIYSNLKEFEVELTATSDKNLTVVTYDEFDAENGITAKILKKMPNLESLTLPIAPSDDFFDYEYPNLKSLSLQVGFNHHNFISELANYSILPNLEYFEWSDYDKQLNTSVTSTDAFFDLLGLKENLPSLKILHLHDTNLDEDAIDQLQETVIGEQLEELHID